MNELEEDLYRAECEVKRLTAHRDRLSMKVSEAIDAKRLSKQSLQVYLDIQAHSKHEAPVVNMVVFRDYADSIAYTQNHIETLSSDIEKLEAELAETTKSLGMADADIKLITAELQKRARVIPFRRLT